MGLSLCCVFISVGDDISALEIGQRLGILSATAKNIGQVNGALALGDRVLGVGRSGDWVLVCGHSGLFFGNDPAAALDEISRTGRVFMWLTQSVTGGMWFEFHQDGAMRRRWVQIEGEVMECAGEPLPEEPAGMFSESADEDRDESHVIELGERVTGISFQSILEMELEVYGEEDKGVVARIRGWLGV